MLTWELKKILKDKSIFIILAILAFNIAIMTFLNPEFSYDKEKKDHYINVKSLREASVLKDNEGLDNNTKDLSKMAYDKLQKDGGEEYKNIDFYKAFYFRISNVLVNASICIIIMIIFSKIYIEERNSMVDRIILSSKNKSNVLYSKLGLTFIIPIFIYTIYVLTIGVITAMQYGLPDAGQLQSYRMVENPILLHGSFTINQYMAITGVTILGLYIILAVFTEMCSFLSKNSVSTIVGSTLVLILFKVLSELKSLPEGVLRVLKSINFIDVFISPQILTGNYKGNIILLNNTLGLYYICYLVLFMLIILGVAINIYIFKKLF